jgi:hypothetical protein
MTISKKWCKLDIDSDNLDSYIYIDKHNDWNLVFAHHEEEEVRLWYLDTHLERT